ncbi:Mannose-6-phosphate isomerase, cupin superfamily [Dyadobacter sp. SG02]|uniref:cupin domain-containing protein n=1 Tax=Dyadobacter sp. SG02 TaxID=1855291 RepID=UPI0008D28EBE|nr:cupin domain-containing protein [Dyadobacter sp. SG02]SEI52594.1 Mannose-6-phosphate isomerase, cupin superfamily [Dyadobacter sp. SG02]
MTIIHEKSTPEVEHPGRYMRWLVGDEGLQAENLSVCVIRVLPGEAVRPAHSHPHSEELIYIINGSGKVMIEGEVGAVEPGTAVLFEQGKVHMLKNTGNVEMKVICFFAPATSVDNYKMFEAVDFPE